MSSKRQRGESCRVFGKLFKMTGTVTARLLVLMLPSHLLLRENPEWLLYHSDAGVLSNNSHPCHCACAISQSLICRCLVISWVWIRGFGLVLVLGLGLIIPTSRANLVLWVIWQCDIFGATLAHRGCPGKVLIDGCMSVCLMNILMVICIFL